MATRSWILVAFALTIVMAMAMAAEVHAAGAAVTQPAPTCKIAADALMDCNVYVTGQRKIPLKTCCEQVQNILLQPNGNVCLCNTLTSAATKLKGFNVTLALSLPQKCVLDSYFKKGQNCDGV